MNTITTFNRDELRNNLPEFLKLYEKRPILQNTFGMTSSHGYALWTIMRKLQPKLVIESGAYKGQSAWIIQNAVPDAKLISIDISWANLEWKSDKITYLTNDITTHDWVKIFAEYNVTPDEVVVFFDDHMNFLDRLNFLKILGIHHVIDDDNYDREHGNCLSPKKILDKEYYLIEHTGGVFTRYEFNQEDYDYFKSRVKIYLEFPPIFELAKTRWNDNWSPFTKLPILSTEEKINYPLFYEEAGGYTWMCYLELV